MAGRQTSSDPKSFGTPASMPEGTPSLASPSDHSWTLQAIMEMQKSIGVLGEKVDRMRDDFVDLKADGVKTREKLVDVDKTLATAGGALKVFGSLYALLLVVVAGFLAWFLRPLPTPLASAPVVTTPQGQPVGQPTVAVKNPAG